MVTDLVQLAATTSNEVSAKSFGSLPSSSSNTLSTFPNHSSSTLVASPHFTRPHNERLDPLLDPVTTSLIHRPSGRRICHVLYFHTPYTCLLFTTAFGLLSAFMFPMVEVYN
jgi:hypothetical protein